MAEVDDRLIHCFSSVFPTLTREEIRAAHIDQIIKMDSLAAVTLVAVIDEEFGLEIDLEGLLALGSFQAIKEQLCK